MKLNAAKTLAAIAKEGYISVTRVNLHSAVKLRVHKKVIVIRSLTSGSMFYAAPGFERDGFVEVVL